MMEPAVTLTDYALACECLVFAYLLRPARSQPVVFASVAFFLSTALASALGGTVHGYFEDSAARIHGFLWNLTLVTLGITTFAGTRIAALLLFRAPAVRMISWIAAVVFVAYCTVVLFISNSFVVAIINYLPIVLFLAWAFLTAYKNTRHLPLLAGFAGICVMLAAAGLQQAKIGVHPLYFNHNVLYHVLQGVGLFMMFISAHAPGQSEVAFA